MHDLDAKSEALFLLFSHRVEFSLSSLSTSIHFSDSLSFRNIHTSTFRTDRYRLPD